MRSFEAWKEAEQGMVQEIYECFALWNDDFRYTDQPDQTLLVTNEEAVAVTMARGGIIIII